MFNSKWNISHVGIADFTTKPTMLGWSVSLLKLDYQNIKFDNIEMSYHVYIDKVLTALEFTLNGVMTRYNFNVTIKLLCTESRSHDRGDIYAQGLAINCPGFHTSKNAGFVIHRGEAMYYAYIQGHTNKAQNNFYPFPLMHNNQTVITKRCGKYYSIVDANSVLTLKNEDSSSLELDESLDEYKSVHFILIACVHCLFQNVFINTLHTSATEFASSSVHIID